MSTPKLIGPQQVARCQWCETPMPDRDPNAGGKPQRFCSNACRSAFHTACRKLGAALIDQGLVTPTELRSATARLIVKIFAAQQRARCSGPEEPLTPARRKAG